MNAWRCFKNLLFNALCAFSALLMLSLLCIILWTLVSRGLPGFHLSLFFQSTPSPNSVSGGLANAIVGSLILNALAILIAAPFGILIATYLVEFSQKSTLSKWIRFANDVLLSAPSIIVGLLIYALMVKSLGHFSGLAGACALAIIALPMIVRATEDVLYLISPTLREAAVALGISRWKVTTQIIYRSIRNGLITAVLLALARIMGETAPLLFTSLSNQFMSFDINRPIANLPVTIYRYAMSPYPNWQQLAWSGALLITLFILINNLLARAITRKYHNKRSK